MAASLNVSLVLSYGDNAPQGSVLARKNLSFVLPYTEESSKIVHVPPSTTDFQVDLDSISAPKFLFARSLDIDVTIRLSDGTNMTSTGLAGAGGWILIANPNGQAIRRLLVTTPATPASGAHVEIIAFE